MSNESSSVIDEASKKEESGMFCFPHSTTVYGGEGVPKSGACRPPYVGEGVVADIVKPKAHLFLRVKFRYTLDVVETTAGTAQLR